MGGSSKSGGAGTESYDYYADVSGRIGIGPYSRIVEIHFDDEKVWPTSGDGVTPGGTVCGGMWDPVLNSPALPTAASSSGVFFYVCKSGPSLSPNFTHSYLVKGDRIYSNGSVWALGADSTSISIPDKTGNFQFFWGTPRQMTPFVLTAAGNEYGEDHPPYRGFAYFVAHDSYLGLERTTAQNVEVVVERIPIQPLIKGDASKPLQPSGGGTATKGWVNPLCWVAEVLTHEFGLGIDESKFTSNWQLIADLLMGDDASSTGEHIYTYIADLLSSNEKGTGAIEDPLALVNCFLSFERETGKIDIGRIPKFAGSWDPDDDTPTLPDPTTVPFQYYVANQTGNGASGYYSGLLEHGEAIVSDGSTWNKVPTISYRNSKENPDLKAEGWFKLSNRFKVTFADSTNDFKNAFATADNRRARQIAGGVIQQNINRRCITRFDQAQRHARDISNRNPEPRQEGTCDVFRGVSNQVRPGSIVVVDIDPEPGSTQLRQVCFVEAIRRPKKGMTVIDFAVDQSAIIEPYVDEWDYALQGIETIPEDITRAVILQATPFLNGGSPSGIIVLADRPSNIAEGFVIWYSEQPDSGYVKIGTQRNFAIPGHLRRDYDAQPEDIIGEYQGEINTFTDLPDLPAAAPSNAGHYYKVLTAVGGPEEYAGTYVTISGLYDNDKIISNGEEWVVSPAASFHKMPGLFPRFAEYLGNLTASTLPVPGPSNAGGFYVTSLYQPLLGITPEANSYFYSDGTDWTYFLNDNFTDKIIATDPGESGSRNNDLMLFTVEKRVDELFTEDGTASGYTAVQSTVTSASGRMRVTYTSGASAEFMGHKAFAFETGKRYRIEGSAWTELPVKPRVRIWKTGDITLDLFDGHSDNTNQQKFRFDFTADDDYERIEFYGLVSEATGGDYIEFDNVRLLDLDTGKQVEVDAVTGAQNYEATSIEFLDGMISYPVSYSIPGIRRRMGTRSIDWAGSDSWDIEQWIISGNGVSVFNHGDFSIYSRTLETIYFRLQPFSSRGIRDLADCETIPFEFGEIDSAYPVITLDEPVNDSGKDYKVVSGSVRFAGTVEDVDSNLISITINVRSPADQNTLVYSDIFGRSKTRAFSTLINFDPIPGIWEVLITAQDTRGNVTVTKFNAQVNDAGMTGGTKCLPVTFTPTRDTWSIWETRPGITLESGTAGVTIYYAITALNETTTPVSWSTYSGPLPHGNFKVWAYAEKGGLTDSEVSWKKYYLETEPPEAEPIARPPAQDRWGDS